MPTQPVRLLGAEPDPDEADVLVVRLEVAVPRGEPESAVRAYTVKRAAEILDCNVSTVWELLRDGALPSFQIGTRRRISSEDLAEFIRRQPRRPTRDRDAEAS